MVTGVTAGLNNAYTLGSLTASTRTGAARTVDVGMINLVSTTPPQQPDVGGGKLPGTASEYTGILDNMPQPKKTGLAGIYQNVVNWATRNAINSRASG